MPGGNVRKNNDEQANYNIAEKAGPQLSQSVPRPVQNSNNLPNETTPSFATVSVTSEGNPAGMGLQSNYFRPDSQSQDANVSTLEFKYSSENTQLGTYLDLAYAQGASDIHFTVGFPPLLRINGKLAKIVGSDTLTSEAANKMFLQLVGPEKYKQLLEEKELDFSINFKEGVRYRVNLYFESGNIAGAFRLIMANIRTIEELYLPQILHELIKLPYGLILATGPTGSGKSTTLAGMINEINMTQAKHIITIEDPIEYIYPKALALVDQRELGRDTMSWENSLRSALRQDPDVVLVGEMRDYATIASVITIAETGHLVFSTLHTNSAAQALDRIIDVFPEHQQSQVRGQLANVISAVISQRLVPTINGGRRVAVEILIGTPAVKSAIREGKIYQIDNMIMTSADIGMISLEKSLAELVHVGAITKDVALSSTVHPDELKQLIGI